MAQWNAMGAPSFASATSYPGIPSGETMDPPCYLPAGFFKEGGAGFESFANGTYCQFTSWQAFLNAGGSTAAWNAAPDYTNVVPSDEVRSPTWCTN
jgi:hypothetical protein